MERVRGRWRRGRREKGVGREERGEGREREKELHRLDRTPPQIDDSERCGRGWTAEEVASCMAVYLAFGANGMRSSRCTMFVAFQKSAMAGAQLS